VRAQGPPDPEAKQAIIRLVEALARRATREDHEREMAERVVAKARPPHDVEALRNGDYIFP